MGTEPNFVCALQASGPFAPLILDGAVNGVSFEWYVREILCPALTPGQVVVQGNLSAHHRAPIRTHIEAWNCMVLFLPPYSPDFNPTQGMFSKVKALVRAREWRDRTALLQGIWDALNAVSLRDVFGWFTHAFPDIF
ncbi:transposase [Deinococcus hopiensis]|uniref:transposase n=1 Tax=Deinococcus hopiensis TaxID=309885 RepID=UPI002481A9E1|nr:transposase [Deinococcus hopiensis]